MERQRKRKNAVTITPKSEPVDVDEEGVVYAISSSSLIFANENESDGLAEPASGPVSAFDDPLSSSTADLKQLLEKVDDLEAQLSTCLANQALMCQFIGKVTVLEGRFEQLKTDTDSSIVQIKKDFARSAAPPVKASQNQKQEFIHNGLDDVDVADDEPSDCDEPTNDDNDHDFSGTDGELKSAKRAKVKKSVFRCSTCPSEFSRKHALIKHQFFHSLESANEPKNSSKSTSPANKTRAVTSANSSDKTCALCDMVITRSTDIRSHMLTAHGIVTVQECTICKELFSDEQQFMEHAQEEHAGSAESVILSGTTDEHTQDKSDVETNTKSKFQCSTCSKQCTSKTDLYYHHRKTHPKSLRPFDCKLCDEACKSLFFSAEDLAEHYTTKHPTPNGLNPTGKKCSECGLILTRSTNLKRHLLFAHSIGTKLVCDVCNQSFNARENLTAHQIRHHGKLSDAVKDAAKAPAPTEFPCPECHKVFGRKNILQVHLPACRGQKPFQCDECERAFSNKSNLRDHQQNIHRRSIEHLCPDCGKSFHGTSNYRDHRLIHTEEEKKHKCKFCGRAFLRQFHLRTHEQIHTGELNYPCPYCDKRFRIAGTLNRHIVLHTGKKPHICDLCGWSFTQRYTLMQHKLAHARGTTRSLKTGTGSKPKRGRKGRTVPAIQADVEKQQDAGNGSQSHVVELNEQVPLHTEEVILEILP